MKNKILSVVLMALLSAGMTACGFSVSGGSGGGSDNNNPAGDGGGGVNPVEEKDKVSGISIEGRWVSECVQDPMSFEKQWVIFDVEYTGRKVVRKSPQYADPKCTQLKQDRVWTGVFHFVAQLKNQIYQIEYKFTNGGITGDNLKLDSQGLWISDRRIGEGMIPDVLLKKVAQPTPPTQPVEPGQPSNPPVAGPFVLKSGDYSPQGTSFDCPANIGVGKQNGVVIQIMATFGGACGNSSYTVPCTGNVCRSEGGRFTVTFLSETSFQLKLDDGTTENYSRR